MVFEISSVKSGSRFGGLSSSKFFVRNCPHPQRVRHLEGLNGSMICNVNDDLTRNRPKRNKSLNIHKNNLPVIERTRRVERLVPPVDFWHAHGVLPDTDSWKQELASLASASGIAVEKDDQKYSNKPSTADDQKNSLRSGAHYSRQTGRFNEGTSKSRGRTATKRGTGQSEALFNVPENERDMWMLQVLCQILDTSNLEDVQSWLVSASPYEKEQARTMINSALQGLKESERASHQLNEPIDFDSLCNFVERQKNEEKNASQKYINDTLNQTAPVLQSVDEQEQQPNYALNDTWDVGLNSTSSYIFGANNKNEPYNEYEQNQQQDNNQVQQTEILELDDDNRRPQTTSPTKVIRFANNYESPRQRPVTSLRHSYNVESAPNNDDMVDYTIIDMTGSKTKFEYEDYLVEKKRSRRLRDLQKKLARQEEESKKLFEELQTKQIRLENAIRTLAKQGSARNKNPDGLLDPIENPPVVNVIIQPPKGKEHRSKSSKPRYTPFIHADTKSKKNQDNYNIEDVKVQISLSRLDNQQPKVVYSGGWKPDTETLPYIQGC
ncbi:unnamed protein product [Adineta steineri]|uniref:Uncharacterized protein n=1 Tax=Adineta steineri TaxID=433720 RepID=A0A813RJZ3_9BILA|nr:unnamed protein product [Adineta steineri]CAF3669859.1 unnamed protein product [Adineta steineri]